MQIYVTLSRSHPKWRQIYRSESHSHIWFENSVVADVTWHIGSKDVMHYTVVVTGVSASLV